MQDNGLLKISAELESLSLLINDGTADKHTVNHINQRLGLLNALIDTMHHNKSEEDVHIIHIAYQYYRLKERCAKDRS